MDWFGYLGLVLSGAVLLFIALGLESGALAVLGTLVFISGFIWLFAFGHVNDQRDHDNAVRQLQSQGFKVGTHDVHVFDNKVDLKCVTLGLHKIGNVYRVTTDRAKNLGGGYNIVTSTQATKVERVCP